MTTPLTIVTWAAWAPSLPDRPAWALWLREGGPLPSTLSEQPQCSQVPPLIRRRCGQNARMVLETTIRACVDAEIPLSSAQIVLGSPNGENHALKALLEELVNDAPLSPTAFTNSLHNVPSGYFGIVCQNRQLSRTVSAFEDTFAWAWLDAQALLHRNPERPLLLTLTDEIPPPPFDRMLVVPPFPYAVSLLLRAASPGEAGLHLDLEGSAQLSPRSHSELLFDFLKWYDSPSPEFTAQTVGGAISWRRQ